jgi:hypothetical protein
MRDPRHRAGGDELLAIDAPAERKAVIEDGASTPLIPPFRFMSEGRERTMTTLGDAAAFLTEHRPCRATAGEWQRAIEAVAAARDECSDRHRKLATSLVQNICYIEGIFRS